jgi:hypothetical protein
LQTGFYIYKNRVYVKDSVLKKWRKLSKEEVQYMQSSRRIFLVVKPRLTKECKIKECCKAYRSLIFLAGRDKEAGTGKGKK